MGALFGLLAAATYGTADFLGGRASRRADVFTVVLVSQLIGTLPTLAVVPLFASQGPPLRAILWGAAAGIGGGIGVLFLYRGLAVGRMSVVAPITGVVAASAPVVFGLAAGEHPSTVALAGAVTALVAVALVSRVREDLASESDTSGMWHALAAGLAFGAFFIFLDRAGDDTGMWPLVGTRGASLVLVTLAVIVLRKPFRPPPNTMLPIAAAGVTDVAANMLYLIATRHGLLSLVAVLTS
ncbi:MAG TPA: DMT family transporter, partial [Actinomycetota bacterium]|nr:DMT family transporter [Actinomycetota bacterium]